MKAACFKRRAERIDRRRVGGKQRRAIEQDRHHRLPRRQRSGERIERERALARQIARHARQRPGPFCVKFGAGICGKSPQQCAQILMSARAEKAEQRIQLILRHGGGFGQARIVAVLSRQHG